MTKNLKREGAHHAAGVPPEQMPPYGDPLARNDIVQVADANHEASREALAPVQPRAPPSRMLRFPEVIERTGLSRTTIWRRVRAKTFPAPIQLGANSIGWPESVIIEWVESRPVVAYATDAA